LPRHDHPGTHASRHGRAPHPSLPLIFMHRSR
jgi:hypothetical protein